MASTTPVLPSTDVLTERYAVEKRTPSGWLVVASFASSVAAEIAHLVNVSPDVRVFDQELQKVVRFS